jgi:predicted alpha/beta superfamily hydrolase
LALRLAQRLGQRLALAVAVLCTASATQAQTSLEVRIDLRPQIAAGLFDPQQDRVGLRGGAPLSWERTLPAVPDAQQAGRYVLTLQVDPTPSQPLAYKFKIDRPGQAGSGWEEGANRALALKAGPMALERVFGSTPELPPLQRTGRIDRIAPLPSAHVSPREVQVWLPPGYEAGGDRRYPVLYLHDGQNVFDAAAAGAEWQVDEAAQRLVAAGEIDPLIIVGVSVGKTRIHDYTPVPGRGPGGKAEGGGAAAYARYLTQELKPLIDQRYRTQPGRESTAVGGSSLGGLVSMWLLLEHGDTFGAAMVVSPSVWWADEDLLSQVRQRKLGEPAPRLWLDVGTGEGAGMVQGARRLRDALGAGGWPSAYLEQNGAAHDEAAWALRVPLMLRFLQPVSAAAP